jgi:hypothetical protein
MSILYELRILVLTQQLTVSHHGREATHDDIRLLPSSGHRAVTSLRPRRGSELVRAVGQSRPLGCVIDVGAERSG